MIREIIAPMGVMLILAVVSVVLPIVWMISIFENSFQMRLPNGVVCHKAEFNYGHVLLSKCSDSKVYLDPPVMEEIK